MPGPFLVPGPMSFRGDGVGYLCSHVPSGDGYTLPPGYLPRTLPSLDTPPAKGTWDQKYPNPPPEPQKRAVRILLECFLV